MKNNNKEELRFRIRMAEKAQRYDDMLKLATDLGHNCENLDHEDQNLISLAYKNAVGAIRSSLKRISSFNDFDSQNQSGTEFSTARLGQAIYKKYKTNIEDELHRLCNDMIEIIDSILLKKSNSNEMKVFNGKLKGDYLRYRSEILTGPYKIETIKKTQAVYNESYEKGLQTLSPTNSVFLGTALNYAVFYNEIIRDNQKAIDLCKTSIERALNNQQIGWKEPAPEAAKIIQIMRDNITLWGTQNKIKK